MSVSLEQSSRANLFPDERIADTLRRVVKPKQPNIEDFWSGGHYYQAGENYQLALQFDPNFAMAHAALGMAYYSFIFNNPIQGRCSTTKP